MRRLRGTAYCDSRHVYTWAESPGSPIKRRFVSVTTVLKALDKPALPRWASKSVAEYVAALADQVKAGTLKGSELLRTLQDVEHLKNIPWAYAETRKAEGSTMHEIAERLIGGEALSPDVFDPRIANKVRAFKQWLDEARPRYEAMEAAVFSREHGYAGTLDAIVEIAGKRIVLDYKDAKDSYPEHALQLAAYRHAEFMALPDGSEMPVGHTDGGAILLIREDGCRVVPWECGRRQFETFLALIGPSEWMRERQRPLEEL